MMGVSSSSSRLVLNPMCVNDASKKVKFFMRNVGRPNCYPSLLPSFERQILTVLLLSKVLARHKIAALIWTSDISGPTSVRSPSLAMTSDKSRAVNIRRSNEGSNYMPELLWSGLGYVCSLTINVFSRGGPLKKFRPSHINCWSLISI